MFCTKKVHRPKRYLEVFLGNPAHTNPNIPSNLYSAKIWCILLEQQSQCLWISFTSSTELKSSFPLGVKALLVCQRNHTGETMFTLYKKIIVPNLDFIANQPIEQSVHRVRQCTIFSTAKHIYISVLIKD